MSDAMERPRTYEEGLRDGIIKGQEEANKVMEQMLYTSCNPIVYSMPETEAVKLLQEQIQKMKCCENCKHNVAVPYCCHDCVDWSNWELRNLD